MSEKKYKSILLVEDHDDIRFLLKKRLTSKGYIVFEADNGKEALAKLDILNEAHKPCLILCDLAMPIMNGWEFVEKAASIAKLVTIPIVIHTGDSVTPEGYKVLKKPIDYKHLMEVVIEHCGIPDSRA